MNKQNQLCAEMLRAGFNDFESVPGDFHWNKLIESGSADEDVKEYQAAWMIC